MIENLLLERGPQDQGRTFEEFREQPMPYVDFRKIKDRVPIFDVLAHYGLDQELRKSGDNLRGRCPIHGGSNPTQFSVNVAMSCWKCFTCEAAGNVLDFVAAMERVSIYEAALRVCEWFGLDASTRPGSPPAGEPLARPRRPRPEPPRPNQPLSFQLTLDPDHPYLIERGLGAETIATFGLGHCARGTMQGRIAIPIHNARGQLVAYAGRWPGEPPSGEPKYKLPPRSRFRPSLQLFNLHRAIPGTPEGILIVVEGFFDCLRLWEAGYHRSVALMGSSMSEEQARLILKTVGRDGRVLLFLDEDEAGRKGRAKALARLSPHSYVRVIELAREGLQPEHFAPEQLQELL